MNKYILLFLFISLSTISFSQAPISIERVINDLDWKGCSEADVILAFKDNVVKREKEEQWPDGNVSSFILKNVQVGESVSNANIIVNKYNRKLVKIGGIMIGSNYNWDKGVDDISRNLEEYLSSFWGAEHVKTVEYETDYDDDKTVYTNVNCEWKNSYHNKASSRGSFHIFHRAKKVFISIESK
ncbi:MAG: hypothetical protein IKO82_01585 [Prevotella sp.]|nr:hypothetical protein [Prevotella sp.]